MAPSTILIIDDEAALRESLEETVRDLGHDAVTAASGRTGLDRLRSETVDAVLLDLRLGGDMDGLAVLKAIRALPAPPPVTILTAYATAENTIEAIRLGAFDHLTKPIGRAELADNLTRMLALRAMEQAAPPAAGCEEAASRFTLVGLSEPMRMVQKAIGLAADSDTTVLVIGETGTGKELVARALHEHSRRKPGPFIAVNCAAIPSDLLESELFGHVKGAFTGAATDRNGAFRDADGGTLFLDEIGDMPAAMQAKILRVLQDKIVTPVGGRSAQVDVRIVAATHRKLPERVAQGLFREDLYYRLNVLAIPLAPLRERLADIVPLAEHFLRLAARPGERPKRMTGALAAHLLARPWPGNIRELKNAIDRAVVLARGDTLDIADMGDAGLDAGAAAPASGWLDGDLPTAVARLETEMIRRALLACAGNRTEAARRLGINRQLLYAKIERYGLDVGEASGSMTAPVRNTDG
ncbi:sigma-54-dependent Fis family transcriptional regulator [Bosea sp. F3-2]|uniref:sigma-54-dependent transcriptional regulator n=1 Tax=Bosea sp. F3-2 TaxID=2599640 RepID=UPI0011EF6959|nr:sigma-54 dependent transcriptional regulator [Bosea sp. F3-2]QEL25159.1 sigma-54-dependent Fis family transcriptional regulator [Bosea sp. F3-2]